MRYMFQPREAALREKDGWMDGWSAVLAETTWKSKKTLGIWYHVYIYEQAQNHERPPENPSTKPKHYSSLRGSTGGGGVCAGEGNSGNGVGSS